MARTQRNAAPETVTIASHRSAGQTTPTDTHRSGAVAGGEGTHARDRRSPGAEGRPPGMPAAGWPGAYPAVNLWLVM